MRRQDLIRMANQVAQFFEVYPEDQGAAEVAKHLRSFWDPRMRRQLQEYADQRDNDLHPLVCQAVKHLVALGPTTTPPSRKVEELEVR